MYWNAPEYALYQGDLIVVPYVELTPDPPVVTDEVLSEIGQPCSLCGQGAVTKPQRGKKFSPVSARAKKNHACIQAEQFPVLAALRPVVGLVLSQSCDIDRRPFIRFSVVRPMEARWDEDFKAKIRAGGVKESFYLLPTGDMPEAVADLDCQFNVPRKLMGKAESFEKKPILVPFDTVIASRRGSLNEASLRALYLRQLQRDTRADDLKLEYQFYEGTLETNAARGKAFPLPKAQFSWPRPAWLKAPALAATGHS